jgi:hypothetical protein
VGDGANAEMLPRLGTDFVSVAVVVCRGFPEQRPDGSTVAVEGEYRSEDVAALVAALRLPDQPRTADVCSLEMVTVSWFALLNAEGRWIHPGVPLDTCGKVRIEVREAIGNLKLTTVRSKDIATIVPKEATAAGCYPGYADMVWVEASDASVASSLRREPLRTDPLASAAQVRLCVYTVAKQEQGTVKPAGTFEYGGVLAADRRAAIGKALAAAGAPAECSTPASRFALLANADKTLPQVFVELDGCRRLLVEPRENGPRLLAQADAALVALLGKQ